MYNTILIFLLSTLIIYYINLVKTAGATTFDDAYMFIRYANNFLDGHGIAWNPDGVQTYGVTSILYFAITALARSILPNVDVGALLTTLSASIGLLAIGVLAYTCSQFAVSSLQKKSFLLLAIIFTAYFFTSPVYLFHMASGMDTTLSLLCNAFFIFAVMGWIYQKNKYTLFLVLSILAGYLTFLARPDNIIYLFTLPLLGTIFLCKANKKQRIFHFYGWLFFVLAIDTLIKHIVFGDPLPLSFYAKTSGYYEGYLGANDWNPIGYLFEFGGFALPFLVIIIFSLNKHTLKLFATFLIPVLLTFVYYFSVLQIMGFEARYYFPAAAYLIVAAFLMFDRHLESDSSETKENTSGHKILRLAVIFLVISVISQSTIKATASKIYENWVNSSARAYPSSTEYTMSTTKPLPERGTWSMVKAVANFSETLPNGTIFALSEYGYVGAKAPNIHIIDLVGLHDPYFAHHGFSASELINRQPDLIWLPHYHYTKIIASILDTKEFWEQYAYFPGAFDYGIAIRKSSPKYREIYNAVKKSWLETYETRGMEDYLATPIFDK